MKFSAFLIFVGCMIGSLYSYPFETMDVSEGSPNSALGEAFGNVDKEIMGCGMMSIGVNVEKIEVILINFFELKLSCRNPHQGITLN